MTRGDIFRVRLPPGRGHEQRGPRYGVVVHADALLGLSTVLIAPMSRAAGPATFRPQVRVAGDVTRMLVEQLRAVDVERLDEHVGRVTPAEQRAIDEALELILNL